MEKKSFVSKGHVLAYSWVLQNRKTASKRQQMFSFVEVVFLSLFVIEIVDKE